jgi:hypothetical protein
LGFVPGGISEGMAKCEQRGLPSHDEPQVQSEVFKIPSFSARASYAANPRTYNLLQSQNRNNKCGICEALNIELYTLNLLQQQSPN